MKLLTMHFSPASCHSIPLKAKHSHHLPIVKHPQSLLFAKFHFYTKEKMPKIVFVCSQLTLNYIAASILRI